MTVQNYLLNELADFPLARRASGYLLVRLYTDVHCDSCLPAVLRRADSRTAQRVTPLQPLTSPLISRGWIERQLQSGIRHVKDIGERWKLAGFQREAPSSRSQFCCTLSHRNAPGVKNSPGALIEQPDLANCAPDLNQDAPDHRVEISGSRVQLSLTHARRKI